MTRKSPETLRSGVPPTVVGHGLAGDLARTIQLRAQQIQSGRRADILFVLDCTGSMQGEINAIKDAITGFADSIKQEGVRARVVSMPSWELFEQQDPSYRDAVFPPDITARVSTEMGSVIGWDRYVGMTGAKLGMNTFGSSAPLKDLLTKFGFTSEHVVAAARKQIAQSKKSVKA